MEENNRDDHPGFPALTFILVAGSLFTFLIPGFANYLIYDRSQILGGELWRIMTGVLVHFSWSHLGYNAVLFLLAGGLLERINRQRFSSLALVTTLLSSLYFLIFMPGMDLYGGLSGVISALAVYLCLVNIKQVKRGRWVWVTILLLFTAKVGYELIVDEPFFASYASSKIRVVPSTHIIGALLAIIFAVHDVINNNKIKGGKE